MSEQKKSRIDGDTSKRQGNKWDLLSLFCCLHHNKYGGKKQINFITNQAAPPMRGFTSKGYIQDNRLNGGQPVPPCTTNGDINTLDGWNAMRRKNAARVLLCKLGRALSESEIQAEMQRNTALAAKPIEEMENFCNG